MDKKLLIGERIRLERERLGFTQDAWGAIAGGKTRKTIAGYEKGERPADTDSLTAWEKVGLDIGFIFSGQTTAGLSQDEQDLLNLFNQAPLSVKGAVLGALTAGSGATGKTETPVSVVGFGNRTAGRDYTEK